MLLVILKNEITLNDTGYSMLDDRNVTISTNLSSIKYPASSIMWAYTPAGVPEMKAEQLINK